MSPSTPFINRPIATSLLMVAILLVGVLAYKLLPVSALPEVEYPTIQVVTFYPGASPDVTASSITAPLERQFGQMPGLNQMTSTSSTGSSVITLQFTLTTSLDVAEQEVQAAINAANTYLPVDLPFPPIYSKVNPADTPIITLALTSKTMPLINVEDIADTRLTLKLAQLSGVGLVSIGGGQRPAVRIQVNPTTLAAYGLGLEDVRSAVAAANVNTPKGNFDGPRLSYTINTNDQLLTSSAYRPLIIAFKNGGPVRISDVANAIDGAENVKQAAWMNTTPAVIINIQRQPGANVIEVVDRIKALLPRISASLPRAIDVHLLTDRTITIRASVRDAQFELLLAVALVVLVIFLFLRNLPATIIPSFSVPLSLIGTFAAMYVLGFSLNNLTLMALTIATGFVVDDAIVMIENISRYIENDVPPIEAALKGAGQIGFTIMSLSVSLIAVLIPLLFLGDIIGRLFREFAITLAVTIVISAFVSLTLTPMLCSRLLHHRTPEETSKFDRYSAAILAKVIERYRLSLRKVLEHQPLVLIIAVLTLLLTGILFYIIPKGFFPLEDTGVIQGISQASQATSFKAMADTQQALARVVLQDPAVENLSSFIGIDGTNATLNTGRFLITLKPLDQRDARVSEVLQRLQRKLAEVPGAVLYLQAVQDLSIDNRVSSGQYQYSLNSPDVKEVAKWTTLFVNKLKTLPMLQDVASDQQNFGLQTFITIDRDTASRLGISAATIDNTLYDAFGQRQISTMFTQLNQYHVVIEAQPDLQHGPATLNNIYVPTTNNGAVTPTNTSPSVAGTTITSTGTSTSTSSTTITGAASTPTPPAAKPVPTTNNGAVPLAVFTHITSGTGPLAVTRQGQFPVAIVSFNLAPSASLGAAVKAIDQAKKAIGIPISVQTSFEGAAKTFQNSLANEGFLVLAAIIVVYIVLGVLYESYIHPITILSTLPSACVGALLALLLTDNPLNVIALIGIILLIGIVMKNAILMIDFALELERVNGKLPEDAIFEACLLRFRPIVMTTIASMFSAVPLAFGTGMGSELRRPLGIAIIGGLMVSQLLTLYTTPVIYLAFDRTSAVVSARFARWFGPHIPVAEP